MEAYNRSVMPFDVPGRTRATMAESTSQELSAFLLAGIGLALALIKSQMRNLVKLSDQDLG